MRVLLVLAALVLAGCAGDPPPIVAPDAVLTEGPDFEPRGPPLMTWSTLAEAAFQLLPGSVVETTITIPPGTISVSVNLTLQQGATTDLHVQMGVCDWLRETPFVAVGQTVVADCGGLTPATETAHVRTTRGTLTGQMRIVALVCTARPDASACPSAAPVPGG